MYRFIAILFVATSLVSCTNNETTPAQKMMYPQTRKTDSIDTYFGNKIADPYRWLEDDKSTETADWVKAQNGITFDYLNKIPYRNKIKERLTKVWNFERYSPLHKTGKYYVFSKNNGIQNQSVLYFKEGLNAEAKVLLDPNTLAEDGTISLGGYHISKDGKYLAYTINKAGSDWSEIHLQDIATGKKMNDEIHWVKFSDIAWKGNGFFYSAYDAPSGKSELSSKNEFHKIYFHEIGKDQKSDKLIYEDKAHGLRNFAANVTDDEQYLLIYGSESTSGTSLLIKDLNKPNANFIPIVENFENNYGVVHNEKNLFYIYTDKNAPKYQLLLVDLNNPAEKNWKTIITEKQDLLESVSISNGKFVALYLKDVNSKMFVHSLDGKLDHEIALPGLCKVEGLSTDKDDSLLFFSYNTFTAPASIYQYSMNGKALKETFKPVIDFKTDDYETKQVFFTSKDGTKVPMFITHKKGIKLDGNNPCFLFGYGGFNSYYAPEFRIDRAVFLEQGGVYAVPGIRGGGEYGEEWHKDGIKCKKQNVFDDFIAAAEYLIKEKYTSSAKLAINGRSNGGLLIGAVMTQRPDICKVAIPTVGVLDMLRYHKFTIGWAWASDYGTSENKEEFDCLIKYSPLHNIKPANYPATLVTTGDHDDRVVPAHSFKFIATLQEKQQGANPTLVRIDVNAGHGAGKPTAKQIEEAADIWAFVFYNLGVDYK
jgi:prolyl oligopeptidase